MKSIEEIKTVVMSFARSSSLFITPAGDDDPLVPQPEAMTDAQKRQFFNTLLQALAAGGIKAKLPFNSLMACDTWTQVRILVFHFQE